METTEYTNLIEEMKSMMNDTFILLSILEISLSASILIVSLIIAAIFINKLIKPIVLLTNYAQAINQTAHSTNENKKIKDRFNFDINSLQVNLIKMKTINFKG